VHYFLSILSIIIHLDLCIPPTLPFPLLSASAHGTTPREVSEKKKECARLLVTFLAAGVYASSPHYESPLRPPVYQDTTCDEVRANDLSAKWIINFSISPVSPLRGHVNANLSYSFSHPRRPPPLKSGRAPPRPPLASAVLESPHFLLPLCPRPTLAFPCLLANGIYVPVECILIIRAGVFGSAATYVKFSRCWSRPCVYSFIVSRRPLYTYGSSGSLIRPVLSSRWP